MKITNKDIITKCIGMAASFGTRRSLLKHLKQLEHTIELSKLLSFFYEDGRIDDKSSTLKKIISLYFNNHENDATSPNGILVMDFIKNNASLSPKRMARALETMHIIMNVDSLDNNKGLIRDVLATVVKTDDPKELIPNILQNPGAFFLVVMANTDLEPLFEEFKEFSPTELERSWLFRTWDGNNVLMSVLKSRINLASILNEISTLDISLRTQLWQSQSHSRYQQTPLAIALNHKECFEGALKSIEGIQEEDRFKLWNTNTSYILINAIEKEIDPAILLEHLEKFSPANRYALWERADSFGNSAMHALTRQIDITPILRAFDALSAEHKFNLWHRPEKNILSVALTDSRVSSTNRIAVLNELGNFTLDEQFKLWQGKRSSGSSCFMDALKAAKISSNPIELFNACYAALSRLSEEQQYQLWSDSPYPLFLALQANIPTERIVKLLENLTPEHQFEILMAKNSKSIYYLVQNLNGSIFDFFIQLTEKMGKEFWPDACKETHVWLENSTLDKRFASDETWEFYSMVQQIVINNSYSILSRLSLQPESKQTAFYLWQAEGKFPFLSYALVKGGFEIVVDAIEQWPIVKQTTLLIHLMESKSIYFPNSTYQPMTLQNYDNLYSKLKASIDNACSQLTDLNRAENFIKNRFSKLKLTKKIDCILAIEHIKERDPVNFATNLTEELKNPKSALLNALNSKVSKSKLRLFDQDDKTPVKTISEHIANFDENIASKKGSNYSL